MQLALRTYVALSATLAAPLAADQADQVITVMVYNYARIPQAVLAQTEREAARIYRRGGIAVEFQDCPLTAQDAALFPACQGTAGPARLAVRILPREIAERLRQVQESYGFALYPEDGGFAFIANVFAHDAGLLAERHGLQHGVVLGHLLAHEMGHLLLGSGSHASSGIMHAVWRGPELQTMATGQMLFSTGELEEMRRNIAARGTVAQGR